MDGHTGEEVDPCFTSWLGWGVVREERGKEGKRAQKLLILPPSLFVLLFVYVCQQFSPLFHYQESKRRERVSAY